MSYPEIYARNTQDLLKIQLTSTTIVKITWFKFVQECKRIHVKGSRLAVLEINVRTASPKTAQIQLINSRTAQDYLVELNSSSSIRLKKKNILSKIGMKMNLPAEMGRCTY